MLSKLRTGGWFDSSNLGVVAVILETVIVPIFLVIIAGYVFQKLTSMETATLSHVVLHILTPCLVFTSIVTASSVGSEWLKICALVVATTFTLILLSWIIAKSFRLSKDMTTAFVLSTSFVNAGNYGLPLSLFAFGEKGLAFAVIFFVVSILLIFTVGVLVASGGRCGFKQGLKSVIRLPLIYAICAGVVVRLTSANLPEPVMRAANLMSQAAIPVMLVLLGMELACSGIDWSLSPRMGLVALSSGIKLLFPMLFVGIVAELIGLVGIAGNVTILQASMPTAVFATLLALKFGGDSRFVTNTVVFSTLISIVTLTFLLSILI